MHKISFYVFCECSMNITVAVQTGALVQSCGSFLRLSV